MADLEREIEIVRGFLDSPSLSIPERVRAAATAYAAAGQAARERLQQCAQLLNKGLRTEALQLAQNPPPLLEVLAQLDFPGADRWERYAASCNLPSSPPINYQLAEALNRAFAEEQPLLELLRHHRLLALQRAPLLQRLEVVRRIARFDELNPTWEQDVRIFEKARHAQIQTAYESAVKQHEMNVVESLQEEVESSEWLEPPPTALKNRIVTTARNAHRAVLATTFGELQLRLEETLDSNQVVSARQCRQEIDDLIAREQLPVHDPLLQAIEPTLARLRETEARLARQRELQARQRALDDALVRELPIEEIDQVYHRLTKMGDRVPEGLHDAYRQAKDQDRRRRTRRKLGKIGAALAVVLIIAAGVFYWLAESAVQKRTARAKHRLDELLQAESYEEAAHYLSELEPRIVEDGAVQERNLKVQKGVKASEDRLARYRDAKQAAESLAPGDSFEKAAEQRWRSTAVTPAEKLEVELFSKRREAHRQKKDDVATAERLTELQEKIEASRATLTALKTQTYRRPQLRTAENSLANVDKFLKELQTHPLRTQPILATKLEETRAEWETVRKQVDRQFKEIQAIENWDDQMRRHGLDGAETANALRDLADSVADPDRQTGIRECQNELPVLRAVHAWHLLMESFRKDYLSRDPESAEARRSQLKQILKDHPQFPQVVGTILPKTLPIQLENSLDARIVGRQAQTDLRNLTKRPDLVGLWAVYLKDDKVYYANADPVDSINKAKSQKTPYFSIVVPDRKKEQFLKLDDYRSHARAPQCILAEKMSEEIYKLDRSEWDSVLVKLISQTVLPNKETDPILRMILLRKLIEIAGKGDAELQFALENHRKALLEASVDLDLPWMNPERADAAKARLSAAETLKNFPDFGDVLDQSRSRRAELAAQLRKSHYRLAGWLIRDPESEWKYLASDLKVAEGTELWGIAFDEGKPIGWRSLGRAPTVDPKAAVAVGEARPVFVLAE